MDEISKQLLRVLVVFNGDEWLNVAAAVAAADDADVVVVVATIVLA